MRGKADSYAAWQSSKRITPAYAGKRQALQKAVHVPMDHPRLCGKSQSTPRRIRCQGDHPRLCGEKTLIFLLCHTCLGSPPPMRGKDIRLCCHLDSAGITPAYAGKRKF